MVIRIAAATAFLSLACISLANAQGVASDKLIESRARVAMRMLTSPLFKRVTTSEIGRRAGFLSASHFARVMRNRFGRTPLQLRRAVLEGKPTGAGEDCEE